MKFILSIFFLTCFASSWSCDGSYITLLSGPTAVGGGNYQVTIRMCTTAGGLSCANNHTGNFTFGVMGTSFNNALSAASVVSPHTSASYAQVPMSAGSGYTDLLGYQNTVTWYATVGGFGGCTTLCVNIVLTFTSYPTSLTVIGLEGADGAGCANETIIFSPLPVDLISFNANRINNKVALNWITTSEINNEYFIIERSIDGINFEILRQVEGAGTSNQYIEYDIYDYEPIAGIIYYKLIQVDINGYSKTYQTIVVDEISDLTIQLYPNPVKDILNFNITSDFEDEISYEVYDLAGKLLISKNEIIGEGLNLIQLDLMEVEKGIYLISINKNKRVENFKFIKE